MVHRLGGMSMNDSCLMAALWRSRRRQQEALAWDQVGLLHSDATNGERTGMGRCWLSWRW